jgi:hypothetical protein
VTINTTARLGGFFWLVTFVTGVVAMVISRKFGGADAATAAAILERESLYRIGVVSNVVATISYVAATLFVYYVLKATDAKVSLLAAFFSLTACAVSCASFALQLATIAILKETANAVHFLRAAEQATNIAFLFFGLHVLLVGALILRSSFINRVVGVLMFVGGLGWLTLAFANLLSPQFALTLLPYILIPGTVGEGALTLWLLVKGVDVQRWNVANSTLVTKGI